MYLGLFSLYLYIKFFLTLKIKEKTHGRENCQSKVYSLVRKIYHFYLPEWPAIGAAIIGPTEKGPSFVPTQVTSFDEFKTSIRWI